MKKERAKTKRFEVKPITLTVMVVLEAEKTQPSYLRDFLITGEDAHNSRVYDAIRRCVGGPLDWVRVLQKEATRKMVVNDNGRLQELPVNMQASWLRSHWLRKYRPQLTMDQHNDAALVVGNVVLETPRKGSVVINRDLDEREITERLTNLGLESLIKVVNNRVYCLSQTDATAVALALRAPKAA